MNPATVALVVGLLEQVITEEPGIATDLSKLFASGTPTAADFATLRASIAAETYKQFVPQTQLPNP